MKENALNRQENRYYREFQWHFVIAQAFMKAMDTVKESDRGLAYVHAKGVVKELTTAKEMLLLSGEDTDIPDKIDTLLSYYRFQEALLDPDVTPQKQLHALETILYADSSGEDEKEG